MKLSVITICFNDIVGLERTYGSIVGQSCQEFEWIVIDGGSTDRTYQFLQSSERVDGFVSEKDRGIYDAMQKGLWMAKGEFLIFLNSGDAFAGNMSVAHFLSEKASADVFFYSTAVEGFGARRIRIARNLDHALYSVPAIQQ
jgi:glycosyltransferase involved in cell wall biosynthesis